MEDTNDIKLSQNWTRAIVIGSFSAAAFLLVTGRRPAGFALAGIGLATLASEQCHGTGAQVAVADRLQVAVVQLGDPLDRRVHDLRPGRPVKLAEPLDPARLNTTTLLSI